MSQQVLIPGLDPTAYPSVSGAQLLQMISLATFASGVGGILFTEDIAGVPVVPQAQTDTTLQYYIWCRIGDPGSSGNFVTPYLWNPNLPNAIGAFLNWNTMASSSIAAGSIQGYQIAPSTIPASALAGGITLSQVAFAAIINAALTNQTAFTSGTVQGNQANGLNLVANAISAVSMFQPGVISLNTVFSGTPLSPQFFDVTGATTAWAIIMATASNAGAPTWVNKAILHMTDPTPGSPSAQQGYIPCVNAAGDGYTMTAPSSAVAGLGISAAATIQLTALGITSIVTVNGNKTYTINMSGGGAPATGSIVTFQSVTSMSVFLNSLMGTWVVTNLSSTQFTVTVSGTAPGASSTISTFLPTLQQITLLGTPNNISTVITTGVANAGVVGACAFNLTFSGAYANTYYTVLTDSNDASTSFFMKLKIMAKATGSVSLQFMQLSASATSASIPTSSFTASIICS